MMRLVRLVCVCPHLLVKRGYIYTLHILCAVQKHTRDSPRYFNSARARGRGAGGPETHSTHRGAEVWRHQTATAGLWSVVASPPPGRA